MLQQTWGLFPIIYTLYTFVLSEVYDNRIVEDLYHTNELREYGPYYVFGIGAESHTTPLFFPKGTCYSVADGGQWAVTFIWCGQTAGPLWLVMTHGLLPTTIMVRSIAAVWAATTIIVRAQRSRVSNTWRVMGSLKVAQKSLLRVERWSLSGAPRNGLVSRWGARRSQATADNHDGQGYLVKKGDNGSAHRTDSYWNPSVRHGLHAHGLQGHCRWGGLSPDCAPAVSASSKRQLQASSWPWGWLSAACQPIRPWAWGRKR